MNLKERSIIDKLDNVCFNDFNYEDWIFYITVYKQRNWVEPTLCEEYYGGYRKQVIPEKFRTQELILVLTLS